MAEKNVFEPFSLRSMGTVQLQVIYETCGPILNLDDNWCYSPYFSIKHMKNADYSVSASTRLRATYMMIKHIIPDYLAGW
jgi:hypothetical protein